MRGGVENHHTSHYPPALRFPLSLRAPTAPVSCGVAFAMAINKSQSQSLERAGLFLPRPVFSHGQLYVAFSRPGYLPSASKGVRVVVVEVEGAQGNLKGPDGGSSRATPYTARSSLAEGQARLHAQKSSAGLCSPDAAYRNQRIQQRVICLVARPTPKRAPVSPGENPRGLRERENESGLASNAWRARPRE